MDPPGSWLLQQAQLRPDHPAVVWGGGGTSYSELAARVDALAARLRGTGVAAGDRVAVLMRNDLLYVEIIHALIELEAVLVPFNVRLASPEIKTLVDDAEPRLLIYGDGLAPLGQDVSKSSRAVRVVSADELRALPRKPARLLPRLRLDRDQTMVFTSGTTGRPKGARLTFANQLASAKASAERLGVDPRDRWLASLPLYHVGGLAIVLRSAIYGTTVVLAERFDERAIAGSLERDGVTIVSLVPTMLTRLLDVLPHGRVPETLRCVLLGGGPIPDGLLERCRDADIPVAPTYGLTEAASQVATQPPGVATRKGATAGPPLPGTTLRIVDRNGADQKAGVPGEILVRGPQVMAGYWNRPEETTRVLQGGWLHTGDIGFIDEEGDLFVLDRREDLIVSGGENIYPAEVEAVLLSHPKVAEAGVVGVLDPTWGQLVAAFVVPRPRAELAEEELESHCRSKLARFKVPRVVRLVGSLPRTASGKLRRGELATKGVKAAPTTRP